ncbi:DUF4870 domain-containing protein [Lysinibacillus sp. 54212]|uniref:DUF4870 domain-containing protein n=1 Tax=Lysinibacillus sp. 54212 TaxID=3119829 RepID=UPI002FCB1CD7
MNNSKGLSALNYFSIFFAPFIVPIVVYFVSHDSEVKRHSIRALLSHIIPIILAIFLFIGIFALGIFSNEAVNLGDSAFFSWIIAFGVYMLINFAVIIWNVIEGVKVLR